jgi:hypothetical protein
MAIVKFSLFSPATNSAEPFGANVVLGSFLASSWNRGQAFVTLSGVSLQGNLPPTRVTIRRAPRKSAVSGKVVDEFQHPLVGVRLALERQAGASWRRVGSAKTNGQGSFTLATRGRGYYRATVTYAGVTARSSSLLVRR